MKVNKLTIERWRFAVQTQSEQFFISRIVLAEAGPGKVSRVGLQCKLTGRQRLYSDNGKTNKFVYMSEIIESTRVIPTVSESRRPDRRLLRYE